MSPLVELCDRFSQMKANTDADWCESSAAVQGIFETQRGWVCFIGRVSPGSHRLGLRSFHSAFRFRWLGFLWGWKISNGIRESAFTLMSLVDNYQIAIKRTSTSEGSCLRSKGWKTVWLVIDSCLCVLFTEGYDCPWPVSSIFNIFTGIIEHLI